MTYSSQFIDEVVRNVMKELSVSSSPSQTSSGNGQAKPTSRVALVDSVITEDLLAQHSAAGRTLSIPTGAVITPSGRDYIRRHQVKLQKASDGTTSTPNAGRILITGDAHGMSAAAASAGWAVSTASGNFDAANQVAQSSITQRTVCCSTQPSIIACLVNRNTQHRAAVLTSHSCLTDLLHEMNPTTICLCPAGWTFTELRRLLQRLSSQCSDQPEAWREIV